MSSPDPLEHEPYCWNCGDSGKDKYGKYCKECKIGTVLHRWDIEREIKDLERKLSLKKKELEAL